MKASDFDKKTYDVPEAGINSVVCNPTRLVKYNLDLSVLGDKNVSADAIAAFTNQLANGQTYIQAYLKRNAAGCYDKKIASSKVNYSITNDDHYSYDTSVYPYEIQIGEKYWHCAEYYIFMILHTDSLHWQHYGYAAYLGTC